MDRCLAPSEITFVGNVARVHLVNGGVALCDASDAELLRSSRWYHVRIGNCVYAQTSVCNRQIYMHREIAQPSSQVLVDHRDGDGLNNRRTNLREATRAQNARNARRSITNTSGFKGVTFHKGAGRWMAQIHVRGRHLYLGLHDTPEIAHEAYMAAARKHYGEFASNGEMK